MEYKMDPLEYAVMVGVRALSLVAREQLGPAATPEAVAERYIALRQRAYDNLKSEPNPSAEEVVATRVLMAQRIAEESKALERGDTICNCAYCTAARALARPEAVR